MSHQGAIELFSDTITNQKLCCLTYEQIKTQTVAGAVKTIKAPER